MTAGGKPPRHLGLVDATALYAGIILGSGIFVAPAAVAAAAPTIPTALALWLAGGVIAACGASCYAECASRVPESGGFFVFQRRAFGPAIAFVGGWAAIFVTYPASIAAIALVFASYFAEATGLAGWERTVAAAALCAAAVLNAAGLRTGPVAQRILTTAKLVALAAVALAALGAPAPAPAPGVGAGEPAGAGLLGALLLLLWTYEGWSDVTLVTGEIRDPKRNLGRAVFAGTAILVVIYGLVQAAVMWALPAGAASASARPVADAIAAVWGPGAGRAVAALVVASTFGSILGVTLTVSRLTQAMAEGGALVRAAAPFHARLGTPVRAIAVATAASLVYVAAASFRGILAYFTFSVWIFYGTNAVCLLVLRRRRVGEAEAWRAPAGLLPPAIVLMVAVVVTSQVVLGEPRHALAGALMLLSGFPVYALLRRSAGGEASGATAR